MTLALEREDLDRALEASRRQYAEEGFNGFAEGFRSTPDQRAAPGRDSTLDKFKLRQGAEVELLNFADADTIVLIGEPPRLNGQSSSSYGRTRAHFALKHRIHSDRLLSMRSPKFEKLLSIDKQTRLNRLLRKLLPEGKPPGIKYVLDLRPPDEDEEAILLLTELSCTRGVLNWCHIAEHFSVSPLMKGGRDDIEHLQLVNIPAQQPSTNPSDVLEKEKGTPIIVDGETSASKTSDWHPTAKGKEPPRVGNWEGCMPRPPSLEPAFESEVPGGSSAEHNASMTVDRPDNHIHGRGEQIQPIRTLHHGEAPEVPELEYSPLRHRSAIERVLSAIEFQDPCLDSAPKVWNYFGIAKHLDCATHERVNGWITKWLYAFPNSNFIQCNPEVCYRIGLGIKSEVLTRNAFAILVGEQALMRVHSRGQALGSVSVHGRSREHLDDDEQNRVTHAADQLVSRMQEHFHFLLNASDDLFDGSGDYALLKDFQPRNKEERGLQQTLIKSLRGYIRMRMLAVLFKVSEQFSSILPGAAVPDHVEHNTGELKELISGITSFRETYFHLPADERIFTRTFWTSLMLEDFWRDDLALFESDVARELSDTLGGLTSGLDVLPFIKRDRLQNLVDSYNVMIDERNEADRDAAVAVHQKPEYRPSSNKWEAQNATNTSDTVSPKRPKGVAFLFDDPRTWLKRRRVSQDLEPTDSPSNATSTGFTSHLPFRDAVANLASEDLPIRPRKGKIHESSDGSDGLAFEPQTSTPTAQTQAPWLQVRNPDLSLHQLGDSEQAQFYASGEQIYPEDRSEGSLYVHHNERGSPSPQPDPSQQDRYIQTGSSSGLALPHPSFSLNKFLHSVNKTMGVLTHPIIDPSHLYHLTDRIPIRLLDTLLNLGDNEWKYLPLWAGGNDDGTGGVFDESNVPNLESGGFSAPGPDIHNGMTPVGSMVNGDISDSESYSIIDSEAQSTIAKASVRATDGTMENGSTVKSLSTTISEAGEATAAADMDPLWQMIREKQDYPGLSDFESTVPDAKDEEDDISIIDARNVKGKETEVYQYSSDHDTIDQRYHDDDDFFNTHDDDDFNDDDNDDDDTPTERMSDASSTGVVDIDIDDDDEEAAAAAAKDDDDNESFRSFEKLDVNDIATTTTSDSTSI